MNIICITNRHLCEEDFLLRIERLAKAKPTAILLREKDLSETAYEQLAQDCKKICLNYGVPLILHSYSALARKLQIKTIQLPLWKLRENPSATEELRVGVSVHSKEDAEEAVKLHAAYLIAGHIFETDCKKDLPGRGISFLKEVCKAVPIPVYAIGGITAERLSSLQKSGAAGVCLMSTAMQCKNPEAFIGKG